MQVLVEAVVEVVVEDPREPGVEEHRAMAASRAARAVLRRAAARVPALEPAPTRPARAVALG